MSECNQKENATSQHETWPLRGSGGNIMNIKREYKAGNEAEDCSNDRTFTVHGNVCDIDSMIYKTVPFRVS